MPHPSVERTAAVGSHLPAGNGKHGREPDLMLVIHELRRSALGGPQKNTQVRHRSAHDTTQLERVPQLRPPQGREAVLDHAPGVEFASRHASQTPNERYTKPRLEPPASYWSGTTL